MTQYQEATLRGVPQVATLAVKSSNKLLEAANDYGTSKAVKASFKSFGHAVYAGVFIAIAFIFYITVTTGAGDNWGSVKLQGGVAFSLGLILVVIAGGELFTSTVLSSVSRFAGRITSRQLAVCWARVYLGNFVGAALMVLLVMAGKLYELDHNIWGLNALNIAQHKLHHTWVQAFSLGILCNLLVCLGVWMTFSAKDSLTKALLLILPVAMFVSSGFEHCIANLFMVPLGIAIQNFAPVEFFSSLDIGTAQFSDLTISHFLFNNLIPVTLGNIVGGAVVVGLGYWLIDKPKPAIISAATPVDAKKNQTNSLSAIDVKEDTLMKNTLKDKTVRDIMVAAYTALLPSDSITEALCKLANEKSALGMVVDTKGRLLGVISEQDLLRYLCVVDFQNDPGLYVRDIMETDVVFVNPNDSATSVIEYMSVDQDKLYPVSGSGILTDMTNMTFEGRLKNASANKPRTYPVVEQGRLIGLVQRSEIVAMLANAVSRRIEMPALKEDEALAEA